MNDKRSPRRGEPFGRTIPALLAILLAPAPSLAAQSPLAAAAASVARREAAVARHVVVISVDGLRPDAIERAEARTLQRLMREGAWSPRARTVLPSLTLPSHTSMLTGVGPEAHGITWNEDRSRRTGPVRAPTLFDVAEDAGVETAAVFGKAKFRHLLRPGTPDWREAPRGNEIWYAERLAGDVEQMLRRRRPGVLFVHLPDPDLSGHMYGWMSARYRVAVRRADAAVERVVRAAERAYGGDVVVIVTADHGGAGREHGGDTPAERSIPWIAWGRGVAPGEIAGPVDTVDTAATVLWLLGVAVPPAWEGRPVTAAFRLPGRQPAAQP